MASSLDYIRPGSVVQWMHVSTGHIVPAEFVVADCPYRTALQLLSGTQTVINRLPFLFSPSTVRVVTLNLKSDPSRSLRVHGSGNIDYIGHAGPWCLFAVVPKSAMHQPAEFSSSDGGGFGTTADPSGPSFLLYALSSGYFLSVRSVRANETRPTKPSKFSSLFGPKSASPPVPSSTPFNPDSPAAFSTAATETLTLSAIAPTVPSTYDPDPSRSAMQAAVAAATGSRIAPQRPILTLSDPDLPRCLWYALELSAAATQIPADSFSGSTGFVAAAPRTGLPTAAATAHPVAPMIQISIPEATALLATQNPGLGQRLFQRVMGRPATVNNPVVSGLMRASADPSAMNSAMSVEQMIRSSPVHQFSLSDDQVSDFYQNGFLVLRGVVPVDLIDNAVQRINAAVGDREAALDRFVRDSIARASGLPATEVPGVRRGSENELFAMGPVADDETLRSAPEILSLVYRSQLWAIVNALISGPARGGSTASRTIPVRQGQVALRYPEKLSVYSAAERAAAIETDRRAHNWHTDGLFMGKLSPFALLCGVALSDQDTDGCGNLGVFPGSHHALVQSGYLRVATAEFGRWLQEHPNHRDVDWMEKARLEATGRVPKQPELGPCRFVHLRRGDVVLAHQKVAHRVTHNFSPNIRYQIYFRFLHAEHARMERDGTIADDLWTEFDGVREWMSRLAAPSTVVM